MSANTKLEELQPVYIKEVKIQLPDYYTVSEGNKWLLLIDNHGLKYVLRFINLELLRTEGIAESLGIRRIWHPSAISLKPTYTDIHSLLWGFPEERKKQKYIRWDVINGFTTKKFRKVHVR